MTGLKPQGNQVWIFHIWVFMNKKREIEKKKRGYRCDALKIVNSINITPEA